MSTVRPWLAWYPADIFNDPKYIVLSRSAKLTYRELLDRCWLAGSVLPSDPRKLAALAGMDQASFDADWAELQDSADPCFITHPVISGFLTNKRIRAEWQIAEANAERARDNGKKGGRPALINTGEKTHPVISGLAKPNPEKSSSSLPLPEEREDKTKMLPSEACGEVPKAAPSPPASPAVLTVPLIPRDGQFDITQEDVDQWQDTFPAVAVLAELKRLRQWSLDNPKNRKTRAGFRSHASAWLGRTQDKAARKNPGLPLGRKAGQDDQRPDPYDGI